MKTGNSTSSLRRVSTGVPGANPALILTDRAFSSDPLEHRTLATYDVDRCVVFAAKPTRGRPVRPPRSESIKPVGEFRLLERDSNLTAVAGAAQGR